MMKTEELNLTESWDKVFPKSEKVEHRKVTFVNHFGITLAADMYSPKAAKGKLPAIAVSGPFSPDIDVEDFQAAVDFLSVQENVDPERIGIIGICGWGGMALQTACVDTRIKVTVTSTMYDMSRVAGNGYFDEADSEEARHQARQAINARRTEDYRNGEYARQGGVVDPLPEGAPYFVADYHDYYKTPRGYHPRSLNSNDGWAASTGTSLMNTRLFTYSKEIRSAVLMIHGDKGHSCYMSRDAYAGMVKDSKYAHNKELLIIPGASHTDLYDGGGKNAIPFDRIESFMKENLK